MINNIETILGHSLEALNNYRHYIKMWKKNDSNSDRVLLNLLTSKAHTNHFVQFLNNLDASETGEYFEQKERLINLKNKTDTIFNNQVLTETKRIDQALSTFNVSESEQYLENFLSCYEDMTLSDDEDEDLNLINQYASNFLNIFFEEKALYLELKENFEEKAEKKN